MMRIESAAVAGVCIVAVGCSMSASKPRGFIGDTGEGWNTTSNVRVRASGEKPTREAIHIIDGSGIDPTGRFHTHYLYPAEPPPGAPPYPHPLPPGRTMWLSGNDDGDHENPRGGTIPGNHWIEFTFDRDYHLDQMCIWNYNENNHANRSDGVPPHYYWSAEGMRDITIQYSTTGGTDPGEWTTIYDGEIECAIGQPEQPVNLVVQFGGARARYVVITTDMGNKTSWVEEHTNVRDRYFAGISEVRFYPAER